MHRLRFCLISIALAAALFSACSVDLGSDSAPSCVNASDCPTNASSVDDCERAVCRNGVCGVEPLADGTHPTAGESPGDCVRHVCRSGTLVCEFDPTDPPAPSSVCKVASCTPDTLLPLSCGASTESDKPDGTRCPLPSGAVGICMHGSCLASDGGDAGADAPG
jgi:hypothetical protein